AHPPAASSPTSRRRRASPKRRRSPGSASRVTEPGDRRLWPAEPWEGTEQLDRTSILNALTCGFAAVEASDRPLFSALLEGLLRQVHQRQVGPLGDRPAGGQLGQHVVREEVRGGQLALVERLVPAGGAGVQ